MKKFLCAVVVVFLMAGCAFASHRVGVCMNFVPTQEDFRQASAKKIDPTAIYSDTTERPEFAFYDSLTALLLALEKGEIDEILEPEDVANYIMNTNPEYFIRCVIVSSKNPVLLSLGFKEGRENLRDEINNAIIAMKKDGTLINLQAKYITPNTAVLEEEIIKGARTFEPVTFEKFDDAETLKVAVTGDLPPIDYVAADGTPEGFNMALLAEIGRRIHKNISLMNVETGGRVAALSSGRADVVFWFANMRNVIKSTDAPEGIILSEPYYEWDMFYHLRKH